MGLKTFFIMRFVAIAAISLISHYILPAIPLPSPFQPEPVWWLITGLSTILIMTSAYKQLQREPTEPEEIVHHPSEFDLNNPKDVEKLLTPHEQDEKLGDTEINVLSSNPIENPSNPHNPKLRTPTKREINRAIKRKFLNKIEEGDMDVTVVVEKKEDGKLEIKSAKGTIATKKKSPKPQKHKPGPIETSRG